MRLPLCCCSRLSKQLVLSPESSCTFCDTKYCDPHRHQQAHPASLTAADDQGPQCAAKQPQWKKPVTVDTLKQEEVTLELVVIEAGCSNPIQLVVKDRNGNPLKPCDSSAVKMGQASSLGTTTRRETGVHDAAVAGACISQYAEPATRCGAVEAAASGSADPHAQQPLQPYQQGQHDGSMVQPQQQQPVPALSTQPQAHEAQELTRQQLAAAADSSGDSHEELPADDAEQQEDRVEVRPEEVHALVDALTVVIAAAAGTGTSHDGDGNEPGPHATAAADGVVVAAAASPIRKAVASTALDADADVLSARLGMKTAGAGTLNGLQLPGTTLAAAHVAVLAAGEELPADKPGELCVWQRILFASRLHQLLADGGQAAPAGKAAGTHGPKPLLSASATAGFSGSNPLGVRPSSSLEGRATPADLNSPPLTGRSEPSLDDMPSAQQDDLQHQQPLSPHALWLRELHQEALETAAARAAAAVAATEGRRAKLRLPSWGVAGSRSVSGSGSGLKLSPQATYSSQRSSSSSSRTSSTFSGGSSSCGGAGSGRVVLPVAGLVPPARPGYRLGRRASLPSPADLSSSSRPSISTATVTGAMHQPRGSSVVSSCRGSLVDPAAAPRGYAAGSYAAAAASRASKAGITDKLLVQLGQAAAAVLSEQQQVSDHNTSSTMHDAVVRQEHSGSSSMLGTTRSLSRSSSVSAVKAFKAGEVLSAAQKASLLRQVSAALATNTITLEGLLQQCGAGPSGYVASAADRRALLQQAQQQRVSTVHQVQQQQQQQRRASLPVSSGYSADHQQHRAGRLTWSGPGLDTLQEIVAVTQHEALPPAETGCSPAADLAEATAVAAAADAAGCVSDPAQAAVAEAQAVDITTYSSHGADPGPADYLAGAAAGAAAAPPPTAAADADSPAHVDVAGSDTQHVTSLAHGEHHVEGVPAAVTAAAPNVTVEPVASPAPESEACQRMSREPSALRLSQQLLLSQWPSPGGIGSCRLSNPCSFDGHPYLAALSSTGRLSSGALTQSALQVPPELPTQSSTSPAKTAGQPAAAAAGADAQQGDATASRRSSDSSCSSYSMGRSRSASPRCGSGPGAEDPASLTIIGKVRASTSGGGTAAAVAACGLRPASSGPLMVLEPCPLMLTCSQGPGDWDLLGQGLGRGSVDDSLLKLDLPDPVLAATDRGDSGQLDGSSSGQVGAAGWVGESPEATADTSDTGDIGASAPPSTSGTSSNNSSVKSATWGGGSSDSGSSTREAGKSVSYNSCPGTTSAVTTHRVLTYEKVTTIVWRERTGEQLAGAATHAASLGAPMMSSIPESTPVDSSEEASYEQLGFGSSRQRSCRHIEKPPANGLELRGAGGQAAPVETDVAAAEAMAVLAASPGTSSSTEVTGARSTSSGLETGTCAADAGATTAAAPSQASCTAAAGTSTGTEARAAESHGPESPAAGAASTGKPAKTSGTGSKAGAVRPWALSQARSQAKSQGPISSTADGKTEGESGSPKKQAASRTSPIAKQPAAAKATPDRDTLSPSAGAAATAGAAAYSTPVSPKPGSPTKASRQSQGVVSAAADGSTQSSTPKEPSSTRSSRPSTPSSPGAARKRSASITTTAAPAEALERACARPSSHAGTAGIKSSTVGSVSSRKSGSRLLLAAAASRPGSPLKKLLVAAASAATGTSPRTSSAGGTTTTSSSSRGTDSLKSPGGASRRMQTHASAKSGVAGAGSIAAPSSPSAGSKLRASRVQGSFRRQGLSIQVPSSPTATAAVGGAAEVNPPLSAAGATSPMFLSPACSPQSSSASLGGLSAGPSSSSLNGRNPFSAFGRTIPGPKSPTRPQASPKASSTPGGPASPHRRTARQAKQQQQQPPQQARQDPGAVQAAEANSTPAASIADSSSNSNLGNSSSACGSIATSSSGSGCGKTPEQLRALQQLRERRQQQRQLSSAGGAAPEVSSGAEVAAAASPAVPEACDGDVLTEQAAAQFVPATSSSGGVSHGQDVEAAAAPDVDEAVQLHAERTGNSSACVEEPESTEAAPAAAACFFRELAGSDTHACPPHGMLGPVGAVDGVAGSHTDEQRSRSLGLMVEGVGQQEADWEAGSLTDFDAPQMDMSACSVQWEAITLFVAPDVGHNHNPPPPEPAGSVPEVAELAQAAATASELEEVAEVAVVQAEGFAMAEEGVTLACRDAVLPPAQACAEHHTSDSSSSSRESVLQEATPPTAAVTAVDAADASPAAIGAMGCCIATGPVEASTLLHDDNENTAAPLLCNGPENAVAEGSSSSSLVTSGSCDVMSEVGGAKADGQGSMCVQDRSDQQHGLGVETTAIVTVAQTAAAQAGGDGAAGCAVPSCSELVRWGSSSGGSLQLQLQSDPQPADVPPCVAAAVPDLDASAEGAPATTVTQAGPASSAWPQATDQAQEVVASPEAAVSCMQEVQLTAAAGGVPTGSECAQAPTAAAEDMAAQDVDDGVPRPLTAAGSATELEVEDSSAGTAQLVTAQVATATRQAELPAEAGVDQVAQEAASQLEGDAQERQGPNTVTSTEQQQSPEDHACSSTVSNNTDGSSCVEAAGAAKDDAAPVAAAAAAMTETSVPAAADIISEQAVSAVNAAEPAAILSGRSMSSSSSRNSCISCGVRQPLTASDDDTAPDGRQAVPATLPAPAPAAPPTATAADNTLAAAVVLLTGPKSPAAAGDAVALGDTDPEDEQLPEVAPMCGPVEEAHAPAAAGGPTAVSAGSFPAVVSGGLTDVIGPVSHPLGSLSSMLGSEYSCDSLMSAASAAVLLAEESSLLARGGGSTSTATLRHRLSATSSTGQYWHQQGQQQGQLSFSLQCEATERIDEDDEEGEGGAQHHDAEPAAVETQPTSCTSTSRTAAGARMSAAGEALSAAATQSDAASRTEAAADSAASFQGLAVLLSSSSAAAGCDREGLSGPAGEAGHEGVHSGHGSGSCWGSRSSTLGGAAPGACSTPTPETCTAPSPTQAHDDGQAQGSDGQHVLSLTAVGGYEVGAAGQSSSSLQLEPADDGDAAHCGGHNVSGSGRSGPAIQGGLTGPQVVEEQPRTATQAMTGADTEAIPTEAEAAAGKTTPPAALRISLVSGDCETAIAPRLSGQLMLAIPSPTAELRSLDAVAAYRGVDGEEGSNGGCNATVGFQPRQLLSCPAGPLHKAAGAETAGSGSLQHYYDGLQAGSRFASSSNSCDSKGCSVLGPCRRANTPEVVLSEGSVAAGAVADGLTGILALVKQLQGNLAGLESDMQQLHGALHRRSSTADPSILCRSRRRLD